MATSDLSAGSREECQMLRIGVIMYETSFSKGQELVAQRMVKEFIRLGHAAYLITSAYHDWEPVVSEEEISKHAGYVHTFDQRLGIPVLRVDSEVASWPPRRILFRNFVGVLTQIVNDLKLNVLITHSTLWNGPEDVAKFVVWNRRLVREGASESPILFCHMSHFQEASDERYTVEERTFREVWSRISLEEILRHADLVLATTPIEKKQMQDLGAAEGKFLLYPGGIDEDTFSGDGEKGLFKNAHGLPGSDSLVTFLGTVEERKNVLSLIEVAKSLEDEPNVRFVVGGRMEGEYAEQVKKAAEGSTNVMLLGEISEEEKARLIDDTFVNITLSRSEALGISQLEFMFRGVPVVSSGVGGQSWVVRNNVNGVVLKGPDDLQGATAAIRLLLKDPKLKRKLGKNAMQTSSQATTSNLVAGLSKTLMSKLSKLSGVPPLGGTRERLVEARVKGKERLVVTTKRLVLYSSKGRKLVTTVPYSEIAAITRRAKRSRLVLAIGVLLSVAALAVELMAPAEFGSFLGALESSPLVGSSLLVSIGVPLILPLVPLLLAIVLFWTKVKDGYLIRYGESKNVFLEKEFGRALRVADTFSPKTLLQASQEEESV